MADDGLVGGLDGGRGPATEQQVGTITTASPVQVPPVVGDRYNGVSRTGSPCCSGTQSGLTLALKGRTPPTEQLYGKVTGKCSPKVPNSQSPMPTHTVDEESEMPCRTERA